MAHSKVLIFDIHSDFGHFRKYNTTTSPLTYSVPTRTAVAGIMGAILGIEREIGFGRYKYDVTPLNELFSKKKSKIAIQILSPVKKVNLGFNLIDTKKSFHKIKSRTQIKFELLKNPHFRIFASHDDEQLLNQLAERIKNKNFHFNPYLGLSQFTTNVDFVDFTNFQTNHNHQNEYIEIISIVNLSLLKTENPVLFDNEAHYISNTMPIEMNWYREVQEYSDVLFEKNGKPIRVNVDTYYTIENFGNILWL